MVAKRDGKDEEEEEKRQRPTRVVLMIDFPFNLFQTLHPQNSGGGYGQQGGGGGYGQQGGGGG